MEAPTAVTYWENKVKMCLRLLPGVAQMWHGAYTHLSPLNDFTVNLFVAIIIFTIAVTLYMTYCIVRASWADPSLGGGHAYG